MFSPDGEARGLKTRMAVVIREAVKSKLTYITLISMLKHPKRSVLGCRKNVQRVTRAQKVKMAAAGRPKGERSGLWAHGARSGGVCLKPKCLPNLRT